jgi:hypothetical protein
MSLLSGERPRKDAKDRAFGQDMKPTCWAAYGSESEQCDAEKQNRESVQLIDLVSLIMSGVAHQFREVGLI